MEFLGPWALGKFATWQAGMMGSYFSITRGGMPAPADRHSRFAAPCYLIAPQVTVTHPTKPSAGTFPLDLFLQIVGAHAEAALATNLGAGG